MPSTRGLWSRIRSLQLGPWRVTLAFGLCFLVLAWAARAEITKHALVRYDAVGLGPSLEVGRLSAEAKDRGFKPGDRLLSVGQVAVTNLLDYRRAVQQQWPGAQVPVQVQRGEAVVELSVPIRTKGLTVEAAVRYLLAAAFLATGTLVASQRQSDRTARLFFVTSVCICLYFGLLRLDTPVWAAAHLFTLCLAPGLVLHFFRTFPEIRWPVKGGRAYLIYVPSVFLMVATGQAFFRSVQAGTGLWFSPALELWTSVDFGYLTLSALVGTVVVGHAAATTQSAMFRQQLKWILFGLACAVIAAIMDLSLSLTGGQTQLTGTLLLVGTLPLPISFGFAILRYRLLDVDLVVRRSAVYAILTALLLALYVLLVNLLSTMLGMAAGGESYLLILFLSAFLIAAVASPLRRGTQAIVDRAFFRERIDLEHVLVQASSTLSTSLRFADLAQILVRDMPSQLAIARAWLQLPSPDHQRFEPFPDPQASGSEAELPQPAPPAGMDLLARLRDVGSSIVLGDPNAPGPFSPLEEALSPWRAAGVHVVLPLVSAGRLVGVYLLGAKRSGEMYQRQELAMLRTLANQAATAISNARLYEEIRAFSEQLEARVQERTQELRDFLYVVSHELNTPITTIQGYTDLLLEGRAGQLSGHQIRFLENARRNIQRLARLAVDLSDMARIDAGRLSLRPETLDLMQAAQEAVGGVAALIDQKNLQLEIALAPDAGQVIADPQRLVQILTNLVGNAVRFTPAGGKITLTSRRADGRFEITVRDTGIGIRPEEQDKIFARFYRGSHPQVREQPGMGLGLYITKSLVELHGGRIWFESEPERGTAFTFSLPGSPDSAQAEPEQPSHTGQP